MYLLSCTNCAHNPLQYEGIGTNVGYCTVHRCVLNTPNELTCSHHFRKDLTLISAKREADRHGMQFAAGGVCSLATREVVNGEHVSRSAADLAPLAEDPVGATVTRYGRRDASKGASLKRLSSMRGVRAEIASANLGRVYVRSCVERSGSAKWTSVVQLVWHTGQRIADEPQVPLGVLREPYAMPLGRQVELAKWSVVILRLMFLSDVGTHAQGSGDRIEGLADIAERAAEAVEPLRLASLMRWVRTKATATIEAALPSDEYRRRLRDVRRESQ